MIILFATLIFVMVFSMKIHFRSLDERYLSKEYTQAIKGIFVVIVFLSHVRTYTQFDHMTDLWVIDFLNYLGQLMVALFLFYSGYGIYEAIKRKGNQYIQLLPKNRLGKTFFDFFISVCLFFILNLCLHRVYPISQILLSFIGWSSIGNSAWYMFAIFTLYILTYLCFSLCREKRSLSIGLLMLCSLGYVYIMSMVKENYWSSTYLCFVSGMWYSYGKESIDRLLFSYKWLYLILCPLVIVLYMLMYEMRYDNIWMFNCVAILFSLMFVFLSMKISFHSSLLIWLGDHLFWVYILQRIPMILLQYLKIADLYPYVFLIVCWIITLMMAYGMQILSGKCKIVLI